MKTQHGVGLIELMVAITIALFLLLGLGTIFVAMRQTSSARQGLSSLQDSERMAMSFLGNDIQGAGYYPNPLVATPAANFPAVTSTLYSFAGGQIVTGTSGSTPGTDTLTVRFIGSPGIQGCASATVSGVPYVDTFSVSANVLNCNENQTSVALVSGVTGMTVLYGEDTTGNGSVTEYVPASGVTSWASVKTVNVKLAFTNPLAGQPGQLATVKFARTVAVMSGL